MLGKRPHREVIEDFEGVYMTYKRQKRSNQTALQPASKLVQKLEAFCQDDGQTV